ncbi:hypothetical protein U1Q18_036353 [Sarracenia purpurea var. burkii]
MSLAPSMGSTAKLIFAQMRMKMKISAFDAPSSVQGRFLQPVRCTPLQQVEQRLEAGIMCEPCNGTGWLPCDFCKGQKTNVKAANNRIYRRCPSCKAIGYIMCSSCKVFKCVTFPNYSDSGRVSF